MASTGWLIELGVVEAVEEVNPAGAGGGDADAEPAGPLGIGAGREGGGFLVPDLDEADLVLPRAERLEDAVDSVAGESEDDCRPPSRSGFRRGYRPRSAPLSDASLLQR